MAGVDLSVYDFDYDLTFAALLMNADGTIYHTYGGRTWEDPESHLSVDAFVDALEAGLETHAAHQIDAPRRRRTETIEEIPWMAKRIEQGRAPECFHCHMVNDARTHTARDANRWTMDQLWRWPDPIEVGLTLERDRPTTVAAVEDGSPAAAAGIGPGARLLSIADQPVRTFGDVQRMLERAPRGTTTLPVVWTHDGEPQTARLRLRRGWKEADPLTFSWRPSKWTLDPRPGFGGPRLGAEALAARGLPADAFAFRIRYIVDWGDHAHTGRNARAAGLRKGDVVLSVGGKDDFESVAHFHAWFRLTQTPGTTVDVVVLRGDERRTVRLPVVD